MIQSDGRFLRVLLGRCFAARVTVQREPGVTESYIRLACSGAGWVAQGYAEEVPAEGYDDWKAGAVAGAEYALRLAGIPCGVVVQKIVGLTTDTTPAAVGAATAYAIWQGLGWQPPETVIQQMERVVSSNKDDVPDFAVLVGESD